MSTYAIVYEQGADGCWHAYAPDVPGCVAAADTREEIEVQMRQALEIHADELTRHGGSIPEPRVEAGMLEVAVPVGR